MTAPNYTWYISNKEAVEVFGQGATQIASLAPVVSNGPPLDPVAYTTPFFDGATEFVTGALRWPSPGRPDVYINGPVLVGPDGAIYGVAPDADSGVSIFNYWGPEMAMPLRLWRSVAGPQGPVVTELVSTSILPGPSPAGAQADRILWVVSLHWQDGIVCTVSSRYLWTNPDTEGWLRASSTDVIREGGSIRYALTDDTRPDESIILGVPATVKFADGRTAVASASLYRAE